MIEKGRSSSMNLLEEVLKDAKERLLEHGELLPMLYVELDGSELHLIAFAGFPYTETADKQKALFSLGRKLGVESPEKSIQRIIFAIEAYTSFVKAGETRKYERPSDDPQRKEVLLILSLDVSAHQLQQDIYTAELLRDGAGNLVDLLQTEHMRDAQSGMLLSFLAGFQSAKLSEAEFLSILEKAVKGKK